MHKMGARFVTRRGIPRVLLFLLAFLLISLRLLPVDAISSASVVPDTLNAGALTSAVASFTTTSNIEIGGKIEITFPSGFVVSTDAISALTNIDPASTFTTDGANRKVIITIASSASPPGSTSVTLNKVTNPAEGTTGTFTVETKNSASATLEVKSDIAGVVISATALAAASLSLASVVAGAVTSATIGFTAAVDVPQGGKIIVVFPSPFQLGASAISGEVSLGSSASSVSVSGNTATITIQGSAMTAGSGKQFTISEVTNPGAGLSDTFSVRTADSSDNSYEEDTSVSGISLTAGTISSATVTPTSLDAGVSTTATITLTTAVAVPVGGYIEITFPAPFVVLPDTVTGHSNIDASSTVVSYSGQTASVTVAGTAVAAGVTISLTINKISNPGEGLTGQFAVVTSDEDGATFEQKPDVTGVTIVKTVLAAATVTPTSLNAGVEGTVVITFDNAVDIPVGGSIEVVFPASAASDFVVASNTISGHSGVDSASTSFTITGGKTVKLTIAGTAVAAGSSRSFTINKVTNPAAKTMPDYIVRTKDSLGNTFEEKTDISGSTFVSTTLSSDSSVTLASSTAGIETSATISLTTAVDLPVGCKISVTFPTGYAIGTDAVSDHQNINVASTALAISGQTVSLTIASSPVTAGSDRKFTLNKITLSGSPCDAYYEGQCSTLTDPYAITTMDSADDVYESSSTISGSKILKSVMTEARVRLSTETPSVASTLSITFTNSVDIPLGGKLELTAPDCFTLGALAVSGHQNVDSSSTALSSSTAGGYHTLSLTVAGSSVSAGSARVYQVTGTTNPTASDTGLFTFRTLDAQDYSLEQKEAIAAGHCRALNDCNSHGQCSILSQRCICDEGWGAEDDIASYRAPDCSKSHAWGDIATDTTTAHALSECSNQGICDRSTGQCQCFAEYTGAACSRRKCPNDCSGHGTCVSLRQMATMTNALPLSPATTYSKDEESATWDAERIFGCVCDSSWSVGLASGETQEPEWFEADCSRRRCPSGDDPLTSEDETDCEGVVAVGGRGTGAAGNLCHVDCSNRGICDYDTGKCQCFAGFSGHNCAVQDVKAA